MTVDPRTFRLVVMFVGVALLACIGGIIGLSAVKIAVPDVLIALGGTIVGYFGGLFTNPHSSNEPTPVTVTDQPVAVTDAPPRSTRRRRNDAGEGRLGMILVVLLVLFLVFGGIGFAVHAVWLLLIVLAILAVIALATRR